MTRKDGLKAKNKMPVVQLVARVLSLLSDFRYVRDLISKTLERNRTLHILLIDAYNRKYLGFRNHRKTVQSLSIVCNYSFKYTS